MGTTTPGSSLTGLWVQSIQKFDLSCIHNLAYSLVNDFF